MEPSVLTDKKRFPTEAVILSHLGKSKALWLAFFRVLHAEHPDFNSEWRYYNDGKSWLMKERRKAKTVFWLSVIQGSFRITAYFTDKAKKPIMSSALSEALKQQYLDHAKSGKPLGITIIFRNARDVKNAKTLVQLKLAVM